MTDDHGEGHGHHGHGHDGHGDHHGHDGHEHGGGEAHEPAERPRFEPPAGAMVVRGAAMTGAAVALGAAGLKAAKLGPGGAVVAVVLAGAAALLAWAGAIHLGGGEKYDDHTWV